MTEEERVISKAFAGLGEEHRSNLRWHAANETRVFCGKDVRDAFVSHDGYG